MDNKKRVFVIMPFSKTVEHHTEQYWTRHFSSYLKPLIEKNANLEAFRSQPLRGDIASQIITDLVNSDIVVADLTDHNPNVLWELGVRQSYKECTVTIAETGTRIPFHFSHKGILFYNGEHLDNQEFEKTLQEALVSCLESPDHVDSPVLAAMGGRGTLYSIMHAEENARRIQALRTEIESNNITMNGIWDWCEKNGRLRDIGKGSECEMISLLLLSAAVELLHVSRYIDLGQDFYKIVKGYFNGVQAINYHLVDWRQAQLQVEIEKWIVANRKMFTETATKFAEYLEKASESDAIKKTP